MEDSLQEKEIPQEIPQPSFEEEKSKSNDDINDDENEGSNKKGKGVKNMFAYHDLNSVLPSKRERKQVQPIYNSESYAFNEKKAKKKRKIGMPNKKVKQTSNQYPQLNKIYQKGTNINTNLDINANEIFTNFYQKNYSDSLKEDANFEQPTINEESQINNTNRLETINQEIVEDVQERQLSNDSKKEETHDSTFEPDENSESLSQKPKMIIHQNQSDASSKENLKTLVNEIYQAPTFANQVKTYINCDLRYINFDFLVEKIGDFDVILVDPPWRIKGGQQNDSSFMFSNNKFSLDYNTMSNQEIMNIKISKLSKKGFCFLWILNSQMNVAYEILERWGYEVVDQIIWVKLKDKKIFTTQGYYFMHSFEICLVGYKCPEGQVLEYCSKISNNLIFAEIRRKSQKPDELYEMIDLMMPGAKKIELFARNHNMRSGWLSLGNQLGEVYDKWENVVDCNECEKRIATNTKRYKSTKIPNYDICHHCLQSKKLNANDFLELQNNVLEEVLHQYHRCNKCGVEPLWGIRFSCQECPNFDLCEACFDLNLESEVHFHDINHSIDTFELPLLASGLPTHTDTKCNGCFQKPIVGICISCVHCSCFNLCQNCFFTKSLSDFKNVRGHKTSHKIEILFEPVKEMKRKEVKCSNCGLFPLEGSKFKCEYCYNFYFCQKCFLIKESFKTNMATTHKTYHTFLEMLD